MEIMMMIIMILRSCLEPGLTHKTNEETPKTSAWRAQLVAANCASSQGVSRVQIEIIAQSRRLLLQHTRLELDWMCVH